ncbi:hypothetical protein QUF70_16385, partial [Desulfobacterales bacterium HSG17]|nr:hypothetical protein [Desulfobacterales bacterium HSG17]
MNNDQKIEKTSNDLLNIKDDEIDLKDIQPSENIPDENTPKENSPDENSMALTDGMIITPSFYSKNKKSAEENKDFPDADVEIQSPENSSDIFAVAEDEESILDLDTQSFLDDEDAIDLNAQTIAISEDNLNSSDFLPFTDSENKQDLESPFDAKTVFAPGGDLDAVETEESDKVEHDEIDDKDPVFELGQEMQEGEQSPQKYQTPEKDQTIELNADTISNTKNNIGISENEKTDIDKIDELFSDFDTKTIIAPNGDLDSLDFDGPVNEDFDINAETIIYSEPDIEEISEIKNKADENLFSDMDSETIIALPDDNEPLDLDDILDASDDVNPNFIDATTLNMSENDIFNESDD